MAKRAFFPLEDPPVASSSDEDEEEYDVISSSEEEEDETSSSEEDEPRTPVTVNAIARQEHSDSDSEHAEAEPEVTPNPRSDVAARSSGKKRPSEGTTSTTEVIAKRTKSGTAGKRFTWSEDDEITLLQRMIDFNADTGTNPFEDMNGFFDFVEKEISFDVSQSQVVDKINNLKSKFIWEKRAQPSLSSKDHDKECLRLAEFVWRPNGTLLLTSKKIFSPSGGNKEVEGSDREVFSHSGGDKVVKEVFSHRGEGSGKRVVEEDEVLAHVGGSSGKRVVAEDNEVLARSQGDGDPEWFEKSTLVQSIASFGLAEHSIKERWSSVSAETKKKLEHEWKSLEETKKKLEHEWKSLESKELHLVSLKTRFMSELASMFAQAI